jgi:signal transduction histidine kinase
MNGTHPPESVFRSYDYIPDGVIGLRADFTVIFWNSRMAEWTGISPAQAEGLNLIEQYPSLKNPTVISRITQLFEGGPAVLFSPQFHPYLIPCPLPDGTFRIQKISCIPMDHGNEICALVVIEDVSDIINQVKAYREMKKIAEEQLEELKKVRDAVFQANKKLSLLNSIIRHDILNQVTPLNLFASAAKKKYTDPQLLEVFEMIQQVGKNIQRQIEFTREYQNTGVKSASWQDVADTIRTAIGLMHMHNIGLDVDVTDSVKIFADPLLQKVFYNLVENSLRHGEKITRIRFSCGKCGDDLLLIYEDDGVGIPADVKERIFRREFFKHTGFGLFLTREILAITNITICENGIPGKGARFEMTVPKGNYRGSDASAVGDHFLTS